MSRDAIIRALDVVGAAAGLVLFSPLLAAAALLVRADLGKPVIFRQVRAGRDNRPFRIFKLRTMRDAVGPGGEPLSDAQRLTRLGRLLRKTSIDELPELVNVLRGEMSLCGPRPLLVEYLPCYSERERKRLLVRPGITGLAQISGRNYAGWDRKLALDATYVERLSVGLYLEVLLRTPLAVLTFRQVAADPYDAEQRLDVARAGQRRAGEDAAAPKAT